ncbi:MAG: DUF1351 domain-containing protein, partial [Lactobacillales bacterium]|nr:DUF1351 domain-containing protein [Lactobacillales bacterium]
KDILETKCKEIKKKCLAPYEVFETKIKELTSMVEEPIQAIDKQVKAYEETQREEKRKSLIDYWNFRCEELRDLIAFDRIFDERWLNASFKAADTFDIIDKRISQIKKDLQILAEMKSEFILTIKDTYLSTLNLSAALEENQRLEKKKEMLAAAGKTLEQKSAQPKQPETSTPTASPIPPLSGEVAKSYDFRVWLNEGQKKALVEFLKEKNIKYGKVN